MSHETKRHFLAVMFAVWFATETGQGAIIADSFAEFSGVQGQDNWYYGYYQGTFNPSAFQLMTVYSPASLPNKWVVDYDPPSPYYWTLLHSSGGHPNGTTNTGGRTALEQWAVRRWISEVNGTVTLQGNIADGDAGGGNGIVGRIFVGTAEVYAVSINNGDTVGTNYSVPVDLSIGTVVDFVIDPKASNELFDSTQFTAVVDTAILGDYNDNSIVDAADYVLWRKGGPLQNEGVDPGVISQGDYDYWRSRFGATSASGTSLDGTAVPEPRTNVLLAISLMFIWNNCRSSSHRTHKTFFARRSS